jgi:cytochrome c oxidase subunit 2
MRRSWHRRYRNCILPGAVRPTPRRAGLALCVTVVTLLLAGCGGSPSTLDADGPKGSHITTLWWVMFAIATVVCVFVFCLLLYAIYRRRAEDRAGSQNEGMALVIVGGAVIPAAILVAVFGLVLYTMQVIASPPRPAALTVEIIGHRWWFEIRYPAQHITTANELHVAVGQPVTLKLTSADVIHSFWVPQIQQKTDMIPGRVNTTWLEVSRPGVYTGECAEYCGLEHAKTDFRVVADTPARFTQWLAQQALPAPRPSTALMLKGEQVFLGSACVYCHTVMGTNASGTLGPDLTHIASRQTIGAGILPNTIGNLAGWIANSQTIKPGNAMPPMALDSQDLQALLAYLESLK